MTDRPQGSLSKGWAATKTLFKTLAVVVGIAVIYGALVGEILGETTAALWVVAGGWLLLSSSVAAYAWSSLKQTGDWTTAQAVAGGSVAVAVLVATVIYVPLGQQYLAENPSAAEADVHQPDPPPQAGTSDAAVCDEYDEWTLAAVDVGNRPDHVEGAKMRDLAAEAQQPRLRAALLEEARPWEAGDPYVDSDVFTVCDNLGY